MPGVAQLAAYTAATDFVALKAAHTYSRLALIPFFGVVLDSNQPFNDCLHKAISVEVQLTTGVLCL